MSKKRNRKSQRSKTADEALPDTSSSRASRRAGRGEFNPDYSYVKKDLRRIAILAAFFLGVLLILAEILK